MSKPKVITYDEPAITRLVMLVEDIHIQMTKRFPYSWSQGKTDGVFRYLAAIGWLA